MLTALGLSPDSDTVYRTMLGTPGLEVADLADQLLWSEGRVRVALRQLSELSLLDLPQGSAVPQLSSPGPALDGLHAREQEALARRQLEMVATHALASQLASSWEHQDAPSRRSAVEHLTDPGAISARLRELSWGAQHEVLDLCPDGPLVQPAGPAGGPTSVRCAVRVRTVYARRVGEAVSVQAHELLAAGHRVRVSPALPPLRLLVVDGAVALVARRSDGRCGGAAVLDEPGTVAAFTALFESVWTSSIPLEQPPDAQRTTAGSRHRELLRLLASGCTDEAAARRLGVSLRTERRLVAELMDEFDARSRFQLGQRAQECGFV